MMFRLSISIRLFCMALLLAVAVMGPLGSIGRDTSSGPTINMNVHQGTRCGGTYTKCHHLVEHCHVLLACMQQSDSISERIKSAYRVSPTRIRIFTSIDLLDPPPRA
jgi:hypothetical protein